MDDREIKGIIEALLFISGEPLSIDRIRNVLEEVERGKIRSLLWELQHDYEMRLSGLKIVEVAGGFQIATRPDLAQWIKKLKKVKQSARLSRPSLETLAIIAYRQPATFFYLPRIQRKIPEIPVDSLHIKVTSINECILCHSESGSNPLPESHAARSQCLYCHKIPE